MLPVDAMASGGNPDMIGGITLLDTPPHACGVVNLRGAVPPVIDLEMLLGRGVTTHPFAV